jgi:hypothetical protein
MKFLQPRIFLLFLLPVCIFLSFNKHSKDRAHSYHGVIWADAAGYYVHLPMWLIYGNNAAAFPLNISEQTGNGFYIDSVNNKIVTKYYNGSAILMAPFFLISHALAIPLGYKDNGFSMIYSFGLYFAGIVYCCLGLFFLSLFLKKHFSTGISTGTAFLLFISSNLYYYSIDSPGMSHVYSFFLFSLFIYSIQRLFDSERRIYYILFALSFVLAVLTRPTNALIILFPFFYENGKFLSRISILLKKKLNVLIAIVAGLLCIFPQALYLKDVYGSYISYSYHDEGFSNFNHPYILEVWFSTNNGLFLYSPILLLSLLGIILMIRLKQRFGYYLLFTFLLISYLFSAWWNWSFGCALGARSFVEFYVLLSIPMAFAINEAWKKSATKYALIIFSGTCCIVYFSIEYYYDGCFYGGTWDWEAYIKLLR